MRLVSNSEKDFLCDLPFFANLPEDDMAEFTGRSYLRTYDKNEYIYHQGDEAERFFVVISGWVKLFRETIDGEEAVSSVVSRGEIFGEGLIFFRNNNYIFTAQAVEKSRVLEISDAALRRRAEKNPEILKRIMNSICDKMIRLQNEKERLALMTAPERVACLLLRLSSHMIGNGGTFTFPYDKSLAAAQLGMKRETFSRALRDLRDVGVTVRGPEIKIENFSQLKDFSCKQCVLGGEQCAGGRYEGMRQQGGVPQYAYR